MTALAQRGLRTDTLAHGRRARYVAGCRCDLCRAANRNYARKRLHAQKDGDWNGLVDAAEARAHLRRLSRLGVGRRAVHAASDVALTVIQDVRDGTKTQIRARTARKRLNRPAASSGELLCSGASRCRHGSASRRTALHAIVQCQRINHRLTIAGSH